jgi:hypothetical protein
MFAQKEIPHYQRLLERELENSIVHLKTEATGSDEYAKTLTIVERLHGLMDKETPSGVSKETLVTVGANLIGILLIIKHEHVNVISSKALGFVLRTR